MRERELKLHERTVVSGIPIVAPHAGARIETGLRQAIRDGNMSLPMRERELKRIHGAPHIRTMVSLPMRERELKPCSAVLRNKSYASLPMRERELKRHQAVFIRPYPDGRSPCGSAN